jgi:hypothetical protein
MGSIKSAAAPRTRAAGAASPIKLVEDYGLTKKQLAETIGIAPEALYPTFAR